MKKLLLYALLAAHAPSPLYAMENDCKDGIVIAGVIENAGSDDEWVKIDQDKVPNPFRVELEAASVQLRQDAREFYAALPPTNQPGSPFPLAIAGFMKKTAQKNGHNQDEISALELGMDIRFESSTLSREDRICYSREGSSNLKDWTKNKQLILSHFPDHVKDFTRLLNKTINSDDLALVKRQLIPSLLKHPFLPIVSKSEHTNYKNILTAMQEELIRQEDKEVVVVDIGVDVEDNDSESKYTPTPFVML